VSRFSVVVCGGGVAGLEAVLRLRRLVGDQIDITLVSPSDTFVYRPLAVLEPFGVDVIRRYPVSRIVSDTGIRWIRETFGWVDRAAHTAHAGAEVIRYDALLLAIGGRQLPAPGGVFVFSDRTVLSIGTSSNGPCPARSAASPSSFRRIRAGRCRSMNWPCSPLRGPPTPAAPGPSWSCASQDHGPLLPSVTRPATPSPS
jgi:NADPH-dependent 2,4-dienoyl-CoA reductase/sulfur reductase-like enzyme